MIYDAGQNSGDNHALVEAHRLGFVGSLPPSDHPGLLAIPDRAYRPVDGDRYPGLRYVDTTVTALGVTRRAVLTHSANLAAQQSRGLDQTLATARRRLTELQARLARGRTCRDRATVEAEIAAIRKPRWVADIITVTLTGEAPAELRLTWRTDTPPAPGSRRGCSANGSCSPTGTGRCPTSWPPTAPNPTPSSASANSRTRTWSRSARCTTGPTPRSGARVLLRACLAVAHLMRRHAAHAGLHLSVRELLDQLAGIEETVLLYHDGGKGRPRVQRMLTDMTPTQQRLADLFDIHRYAPTR